MRSLMLLGMNLHEHIRIVRTFARSHRPMPSDGELMAVVGYRSLHAAAPLVVRRLDGGWLAHNEAGQLVLGRPFRAVPMLGTVMAGFPSPAEEELTDTMSLDEYLIANKEATYILKVNGESMIEAGI